jgi:hypothetical protein
MDQSINLAAGFNHLWAASTLPGLVPGGLQWSKEHGKAGPIAGRPYAQLWVTVSGEPEYDSGLSYLQRYLIRVKVWCGDSNPVLSAIDAALDKLLTVATKFEAAAAGAFLTENAATIHVEFQPAGIEQEEIRAMQRQIGVVEKLWRVTLNETRVNQ